MATPDIDEAVYSRIPILFALDQRPFEHSRNGAINTFGVLVPLMTAGGARFDRLEKTFENRGRVWWLMRPEDKREINEAGSIWTACIEPAPQFDASDRDRDRYQVVRLTASYGAREWVDVLDVPFDPADVGSVVDGGGLAFDRVPMRLVLLRGAGHVVGPFLAAQDPATGRVKLAAPNPGKPEVYVADATILGKGEHLEEFTYRANRWFRSEAERDIRIQLLPKRHLELLQKAGRPVDASSRDQLIKWALNLAGYKQAERSVFREALLKLPETSVDADAPGKMARFRSLCEHADRVRSLGLEAAEALARQPAFSDLLATHAEQLAEARIEALARARTDELERAASALAVQVERTKAELARLENDFDVKKTEQEKRLADEHAAWIGGIERRAAELDAREAGIAQRHEETESRLRGLIERYETRGKEIADEILIQAPILRRMGLTGAERSGAEPDTAPTRLAMPTWLEESRGRGGLSEEAFVAQLKSVAERRGYVFEEVDLVNFHVSVKTGFWTVLAGPSGTGKTSLPRLYAEALGALPEYLSIPVRPDWLDDRDVVGAFNPLTGRFEPAASGLVDRLIAATEDLRRSRGGIYLVCLDEMNLARVEHYFAQFLSVAEEAPARRKLQLFSRGVERAGDPYTPHRELAIGENVRFVGTVNVDETTHFFSPKVLDRAPVLVFEPAAIGREPAAKAKAQALATTPVHYEEYRAWVRGPEEAEAPVRDVLVGIDQVLRGLRSGIGFRLRDRILSYVASSRGLLPADRALDLAIAQGVLPRLRPQAPGFKEAAESLVDLLPGKRFPRSAQLLASLREAGGSYDFFHLL